MPLHSELAFHLRVKAKVKLWSTDLTWCGSPVGLTSYYYHLGLLSSTTLILLLTPENDRHGSTAELFNLLLLALEWWFLWCPFTWFTQMSFKSLLNVTSTRLSQTIIAKNTTYHHHHHHHHPLAFSLLFPSMIFILSNCHLLIYNIIYLLLYYHSPPTRI